MAAASTMMLISAGAMATAGTVGAVSAVQAGNAQSRAASSQAEMARVKGSQEAALAYDRARQERAQADAFQSDLIAKAAAFGEGTADKSVLDMMVDADTQGEYNALTQIYEGQSRQRDLNYQAELTQFEGRSARRAGVMRSFSTVLDSAAGISKIYTPKLPTEVTMISAPSKGK